MSSHSHHTTSSPVLDAWTTDVLPRLPADLEAQAVALGALRRKRAFASAHDLLRGLLHYASARLSLRALGVWGVLLDVADVAPSSWLERLRAATAWLQWLVRFYLHQPRPRWLTQAVRGRVLLADATALRHLGGTGDDWRVHLCFDLLAGQFDQVVVSDHHSAEQVTHFGLHPGDLVVLDGGYGYRSQLGRLQQAHVDAVVRIYPPTFPLETADGRKLDLRAWLDQAGAAQRSRLAYYRYGDQRLMVRVLALRRSEPQRRAAQRRAQQRARKRQRSLSQVVQYFADWLLVVTTLEQTLWPDAAVWRLFAARWQIELVFKRLKTFLGLGQLPCQTAASAVPLIWATLVVWVLHEPVAGQVRRALQSLAEPSPSTYPEMEPIAEAVVSVWGVSEVLVVTLQQAIAGSWNLARVMECLPRLRRYLVSHPRAEREHQASEVVAWLSGVRRTRQRSLPGALDA
jgi:hypothetical protein